MTAINEATSRSNIYILTWLLAVLFSTLTDQDVVFVIHVWWYWLPVCCIAVTTSLGATALSYLLWGSQWSPVALNSLFSIWGLFNLPLGRQYVSKAVQMYFKLMMWSTHTIHLWSPPPPSQLLFSSLSILIYINIHC